jgi:hypothetical protein
MMAPSYSEVGASEIPGAVQFDQEALVREAGPKTRREKSGGDIELSPHDPEFD